jgi:hypothetical protein
VILSDAVAEPLAPVAVTVYVEVAATTVGVPVMMPVEVLRLIPAGSAGLTLYEDAVPLITGLSSGIATPLV